MSPLYLSDPNTLAYLYIAVAHDCTVFHMNWETLLSAEHLIGAVNLICIVHRILQGTLRILVNRLDKAIHPILVCLMFKYKPEWISAPIYVRNPRLLRESLHLRTPQVKKSVPYGISIPNKPLVRRLCLVNLIYTVFLKYLAFNTNWVCPEASVSHL